MRLTPRERLHLQGVRQACSCPTLTHKLIRYRHFSLVGPNDIFDLDNLSVHNLIAEHSGLHKKFVHLRFRASACQLWRGALRYKQLVSLVIHASLRPLHLVQTIEHAS